MSDFAYPLHEECGVFGIYDKAGTEDVSVAVYSALYALLHRGQESCGMAINEDGVITGHRDLGLVNEVFTPQVMASLRKPEARMATGHVRYATAGSRIRANAQPMIVRHGRGTMALCHNGNLTNAVQLRNALENDGAIFHGSSDTEVICYLLTRNRLKHKSIEQAVAATNGPAGGRLQPGDYVLHQARYLRVPRGYRPLCIGTLPGGGYVFASESCALDAVGAAYLRDIAPGEIVVADADGLRSNTEHCGKQPRQMCVFEYIYFARPDSVIEGCSVHEARMQAGRFLAQEHPVDADVVIGVPDSGLDAALGYAEASGIPYGIGFIKNKYIGRTFIQGNQKQRTRYLRVKLNVIASTVRDKRVVLIDDSIVRGTTSARIIKLLRDAGAKEVHFRVSAPPFKYPCYFGTDIPDQKLLVATGRTVEQINEIIGADTLGYLSTEHVVQLAKGAGCGFCTACFTGEYAVKPKVVLSTDIHERPLRERPKGEKKLGE